MMVAEFDEEIAKLCNERMNCLLDSQTRHHLIARTYGPINRQLYLGLDLNLGRMLEVPLEWGWVRAVTEETS